jgi:glycosyltransferase involved in cell wall biosynthesis
VPKVSVVVVNYNQGRYLASAADSVLGQTFQDFEVILVDDGSQDDSIESIRSLVERNPDRLRFVHHPRHQNLGIARTYALGIAACQGAYIAFLEADDRWDSNYLERKVALLDLHPEIGVVFSPYKIVSEGWYGRDMALRQWILGLFLPRQVPFRNLGSLIRKNNVATFSAFVTRKSLLADISLDLPPDMLFVDWWTLVHLSLRSKFFLDRGSVVYWRQHDDSTLGKQRMEQHQKMLGAFMRAVYEDIGRQLENLDSGDSALFLKYRSVLPHLTGFYSHPCLSRFLAFFRRDPQWALESLASYWVNRWKYSRGPVC